MMVLAVGDVRQRIHECHRPVVIREPERLDQRVAVLRQFPAGQLRHEFGDARGRQAVLVAAARNAVGLGEGNEVGHGGSPVAGRVKLNTVSPA